MKVWGSVFWCVWMVVFSGQAQESFSVTLDDVRYGAHADDQAPLGGGSGYDGVITAGDYRADDVDSLIDALAKAQAGQLVFVPGDTVLDLTALIYIEKLVLTVPAGVTLASDRGHKGSAGALLQSDALDTPVILQAGGPKVRISGLRLQGPNPKRHLEHHKRAFGKEGKGRSYYYKFPIQNGIVTDYDALTVDNCDISGFGHAGIYLKKGVDHHIHHNYIHHCQYNGLGYGICHNTAASIIEYNQFNRNRHSIAGTGRPGCSYIARHNVELGVSLSHCFDMHGGRDRKDGTDIAGTIIEIYNNTFRAPTTPIVIRGVPEIHCKVHHNWFPSHETPEKAVRASQNTTVFKNAYGKAPER